MNAKNANSVKQLNRVLDDRRICRSWRHCLDGKRLPALLLRPKPLHPGICERVVARYWSANLASQQGGHVFTDSAADFFPEVCASLETPQIRSGTSVRVRGLQGSPCPESSDMPREIRRHLEQLGLLGRPENNGLEGVVQRPLQSLDAHRILSICCDLEITPLWNASFDSSKRRYVVQIGERPAAEHTCVCPRPKIAGCKSNAIQRTLND